MSSSTVNHNGQVTAQPSLTDVWSERDILAEAGALGNMGVWAWQISSGQLWWSDETYRIFGLTPQEFPATYEAFLEALHPDDRQRVKDDVNAAVSGERDFDIEHRIVRPTGEVRHVHERGRVTHLDDGTPHRLLGVTRDITEEVVLRQEREDALQALKLSEQRHRLLAENAWDVVWTMGLDGTITYVSPSVERVRGFTPAEAAAQPLHEIHPPDTALKVADYFARLHGAIQTGTTPPEYRGEHEYYRKDGSLMLGDLHVMPEVAEDGTVVQILGVTRDISDQRIHENELNRLAITDPLTGVWNRRHGEDLFTADLDAVRQRGPSVSLLVIDIDHFKEVNDTHGHQVGDQVLITLTARLGANLRKTDVLSRWGGEEFVILLRNSEMADATALAEKLRTLVAATPFEHVGTVTVSIGVAELRSEDTLATLLDRADHALYAAKSAGRNTVRTA